MYTIDRAWRMTTMHLFQNAETIDRLVKQGGLLLKTYHTEYEKDPASFHAEFLRGDFAGWRGTVHTLYGDCAEEIIDRVLIETRLTNPGDETRYGAAHGV
jgi:hypothetical protein